MQLLNPFLGYSDFFKSGFRAFTNRRRRKQSRETAPHAMLDTPLSSKTTFYDTTTRRPRSVSVHVTMQNIDREMARQRRSSFPSFSSHWFDHQSTSDSDFFNETSTIVLRRSSMGSTYSRDSEVWIAGGLYTVPAISESSDDVSCDPFSSSSDAKSVFLDSSQDDLVLGPSKRNSIISFTSSSNRSSILFRRERTSSN